MIYGEDRLHGYVILTDGDNKPFVFARDFKKWPLKLRRLLYRTAKCYRMHPRWL